MPVDKLAYRHLPLQSYCVQWNNNLLSPIQTHPPVLCCFCICHTSQSPGMKQYLTIKQPVYPIPSGLILLKVPYFFVP